MGSTSAEVYYLIFIDDKVFGTVGFHTADLRRLVSDHIFEVFCFNVPHETYKNLNRLMMMCICSKETSKVLMNTALKTNRLFDMKGVKTTCLSKYRKVKLNNGQLNVVSRVKLNDV